MVVANERLTEDMVDNSLREHGYYVDPDVVVVEKQQSAIDEIRKALARASKRGSENVGYPEFIVTAPDTPDMVVLIECKADVNKHESPNLNKPAGFAVDGVLHYARYLAPHRNVIAVAASGTVRKNRWSFYLIPKGETQPQPLIATTGARIASLVPMVDLIAAASFDANVLRQRMEGLIAFSQEMHEFMRDEAELGEQEKPLAVAGSLIALRNDIFAKTYDAYPPEKLPELWMRTIQEEMAKASIPDFKLANYDPTLRDYSSAPGTRQKEARFPERLTQRNS